jgi:predicted metal-binding membrane protein
MQQLSGRAENDGKYFLLPMGALVALSWLALVVWGQSPYGRFLSHKYLGQVDHAAGPVLLVFVAGWTLMSAAMMLPTSLPLVSMFHRLVRRRPDRTRLVVLLVAGYLGVWTAFGVVAHLGDWGLHHATERVEWLHHNTWMLVQPPILAGVYQFTLLKHYCLERRRSPLSMIVEHWRGRHEQRQALWLGVRHGMFCLGCCWTLMLLMFAVGAGNLGWMLALGAVMAVEKNFVWGRRLSAPLGVLLIAWGLTVALRAGPQRQRSRSTRGENHSGVFVSPSGTISTWHPGPSLPDDQERAEPVRSGGHLEPARASTSSLVLIGSKVGAPDNEIVIRSFPGEQARIDACLPQFYSPNGGNWRLASLDDPHAHPEEYISTETFSDDPVNRGAFLDTPAYTRLITYSTLEDLRAEKKPSTPTDLPQPDPAGPKPENAKPTRPECVFVQGGQSFAILVRVEVQRMTRPQLPARGDKKSAVATAARSCTWGPGSGLIGRRTGRIRLSHTHTVSRPGGLHGEPTRTSSGWPSRPRACVPWSSAPSTCG